MRSLEILLPHPKLVLTALVTFGCAVVLAWITGCAPVAYRHTPEIQCQLGRDLEAETDADLYFLEGDEFTLEVVVTNDTPMPIFLRFCGSWTVIHSQKWEYGAWEDHMMQACFANVRWGSFPVRPGESYAYEITRGNWEPGTYRLRIPFKLHPRASRQYELYSNSFVLER